MQKASDPIIMLDSLDFLKKKIHAYLLKLAKRHGSENEWKDYLERIFKLYPAGEIEWAAKSFSEDSTARTAKGLIQLLVGSDPDNNFESVHQAFYYPEKLILNRNSPKAKIGDLDITHLLQAFTKIAILAYLIEHYEEMKVFISDNTNRIGKEFPELERLTIPWLSHQIQDIEKILPGLSIWANVWHTHLTTPLLSRFGMFRLLSLQQPHEIDHFFASESFLNRTLSKLLFWLHLPLMLSLLQNMTRTGAKIFIDDSYEYVIGKSPMSSVLKIALNTTFFALKMLFFPLLFLGPFIQGCTSLPFGCLRSALLSIPSQSLFKEYLLGVCDYIETAKDLLLAGACVYFFCFLMGNLIVLPLILQPLANAFTQLTTLIFIGFLVPSTFTHTEITRLYDLHFAKFNQPFLHLLSVTLFITTSFSLFALLSGRMVVTCAKTLSSFINHSFLECEIRAPAQGSFPRLEEIEVLENGPTLLFSSGLNQQLTASEDEVAPFNEEAPSNNLHP